MLRLWHGTFLFDCSGNTIDKFGDGIGQPEAGKGHSRQDIALEWQGNEEEDGGRLGKAGEEER